MLWLKKGAKSQVIGRNFNIGFGGLDTYFVKTRLTLLWGEECQIKNTLAKAHFCTFAVQYI